MCDASLLNTDVTAISSLAVVLVLLLGDTRVEVCTGTVLSNKKCSVFVPIPHIPS